jgi:hypothetical protein
MENQMRYKLKQIHCRPDVAASFEYSKAVVHDRPVLAGQRSPPMGSERQINDTLPTPDLL